MPAPDPLPPPEFPAALRALVIDDDPDNADSLAGLLQFLGCRTAVAYGGDSGLRMLQLFQPDVVFLDILMPGYDGVGVMHRAKAFAPVSDPLFVCVTGNAREEARAIASGFDRFVQKPITPQFLADVVDEARLRAAARSDQPFPQPDVMHGTH